MWYTIDMARFIASHQTDYSVLINFFSYEFQFYFVEN